MPRKIHRTELQNQVAQQSEFAERNEDSDSRGVEGEASSSAARKSIRRKQNRDVSISLAI